MAQLFAHAAFIRAGILGVETYSGGGVMGVLGG